jgi:3-hydroxyacyl-CoA dehydrogenase
MEGATLCVVGAGAMGAQIAHQAALHGVPVRLYSRSQERLDGATQQCGGLLRKRVEKGKLEAADCDGQLTEQTMAPPLRSISLSTAPTFSPSNQMFTGRTSAKRWAPRHGNCSASA